ncbi:MAG: hypothetical protein AAF499_14870 [Pseudomonadota bacterium]
MFASDRTSVHPDALALMLKARDAVAVRLAVDLSHVDSVVANKEDMRTWHRRSVERGFVSKLSAQHRERIAAHSVESRLESLLAYYDESEKAIIYDADNVDAYLKTMEQRGVPAVDAAMALFLHEWVHAADDVRVDFSALDVRYGGNTLG